MRYQYLLAFNIIILEDFKSVLQQMQPESDYSGTEPDHPGTERTVKQELPNQFQATFQRRIKKPALKKSPQAF